MRALLTSALLLLATPGLAQDTIYRTDGEKIEDVKVTEEGLKDVTYDEGKNKDKKIGSAEVLRIEFGTKPQLVDLADTSAESEQYFPAINDLEAFLAEEDSKTARKFPWARPYAMYRVVECYATMNETADVIQSADRLVAEAGTSRYAPLALLTKAQVQFDTGEGAEAIKTLGALQELIDSNGMAGRWSLEREVRSVLYDKSIRGKARIDKLEDIAGRSGGNPTVKNMAQVAIGEQLFADKDIDGAIKVFRSVTKGGGADDRTMAAAYTGLGDCLFSQAGDKGNPPEELKAAAMAYLRVVVLYPNQFGYAPKAMVYAGRSLQLTEDPANQERARKLYTTVLRDFPGTNMAEEARSLRRTLSR